MSHEVPSVQQPPPLEGATIAELGALVDELAAAQEALALRLNNFVNVLLQMSFLEGMSLKMPMPEKSFAKLPHFNKMHHQVHEVHHRLERKVLRNLMLRNGASSVGTERTAEMIKTFRTISLELKVLSEAFLLTKEGKGVPKNLLPEKGEAEGAAQRLDARSPSLESAKVALQFLKSRADLPKTIETVFTKMATFVKTIDREVATLTKDLPTSKAAPLKEQAVHMKKELQTLEKLFMSPKGEVREIAHEKADSFLKTMEKMFDRMIDVQKPAFTRGAEGVPTEKVLPKEQTVARSHVSQDAPKIAKEEAALIRSLVYSASLGKTIEGVLRGGSSIQPSLQNVDSKSIPNVIVPHTAEHKNDKIENFSTKRKEDKEEEEEEGEQSLSYQDEKEKPSEEEEDEKEN